MKRWCLAMAALAVVSAFGPIPQPARTAQLLALRARGQFLEQVDGARWTGIETSEFNLLNIFQNQGEAAAAPIAQQRQSLGFNLARVWTRYTVGTGAGQFLNIDYAKVGPFLDFMAAHG